MFNYWSNIMFINWYYWTQLKDPYRPFLIPSVVHLLSLSLGEME